MITIKKIKLTPKKISGLMAVCVFLVALIILIFISLFLYKNFYQTITQGKEVLLLREKVAVDTVNIEKFNAIIDKLAKKTKIKLPGAIISPFR